MLIKKVKKNRQMAASCQEPGKQAKLWKSDNVGALKFQGRQDCTANIQERRELLRSESNPLLSPHLLTFIEFLTSLEKETKKLKEYLKISIVTVNLVVKRQKWQFLISKERELLVDRHTGFRFRSLRANSRNCNGQRYTNLPPEWHHVIKFAQSLIKWSDPIPHCLPKTGQDQFNLKDENIIQWL